MTMTTKRIPYGISDFRLISTENYYYVDKTRFIEEVERSPRFLFLIRPRRFGKSLWLATLSNYYDVATRDDFDKLFGQYYIGQHPTEERNSYLMLTFNFAMVNPDPDALNESFEEHASICFERFNMKYGHLLGEGYLEGYAQRPNAESKLEYIALRCERVGLHRRVRQFHERGAFEARGGILPLLLQQDKGGNNGEQRRREADVHHGGVAGDAGRRDERVQHRVDGHDESAVQRGTGVHGGGGEGDVGVLQGRGALERRLGGDAGRDAGVVR